MKNSRTLCVLRIESKSYNVKTVFGYQFTVKYCGDKWMKLLHCNDKYVLGIKYSKE